MSRTNSIMLMHLKNRWSWIYIPLLVLASSFAVNFIVSLLIKGEEVYNGGIFSVIVYMFVAGILILPQNFSLALGLGTTRTDFFKGTLVTALLLGGVTALFMTILGWIEILSGQWGSGLYFFYFKFTGSTFLERTVVYCLSFFFVYLFVFFSGLLIGSVYLRFGPKSLIISGLASFLGMSVLAYAILEFEWWRPIIEWFSRQTVMSVAIWTVPVTIVCMLSSLLLIRRSSL